MTLGTWTDAGFAAYAMIIQWCRVLWKVSHELMLHTERYLYERLSRHVALNLITPEYAKWCIKTSVYLEWSADSPFTL